MAVGQLQKILVIEDNQDIQQILEIALVAVGGFTIELCSSGFEGIKKAESFMPHLILIDVMMPEMDGLMTLKKLRENAQVEKIPVIFTTAKVNEVQEYRQLGALGIISKPFDPLTLPETILHIWNNHNSEV